MSGYLCISSVRQLCGWDLACLSSFDAQVISSYLFVVVSAKVTYETGQMSVCPYGVNIFKSLRLRDPWAEINEAWHIYSIGRGTKL